MSKVIIGRKIPRDRGYGGLVVREKTHSRLLPIRNMFRLRGNHFDAGFTVGEMDEGEDAGFMNNCLCALGIREAM